MSLRDHVVATDAPDPSTYAERAARLSRESVNDNERAARLLRGPAGFHVKPGFDAARLLAVKADAVAAHVTVNAIADEAQRQRATARAYAAGAFRRSKHGPAGEVYTRATLAPFAERENVAEATALGIDVAAVHLALYHFALADELYAESNRIAKAKAAVRQLAESLEAAAFEGAVRGLHSLPRTGL